MYRKFRYLTTIMIAVSMFSTACANRNNPEGTKNISQSQVRPLDFSPDDARINLVTYNGVKYVSIAALVNVLEYRTLWDAASQTLSIGDIDVFYKLTANSTQAEKEESPLQLSQAPILIGGQMHATLDVIVDLFQEDMHYKVEGDTLIVHGTPLEPGMEDMDLSEEAQVNVSFFEDDPNDPFKGGDDGTELNTNSVNSIHTLNANANDNDIAIPTALRNIDINALIRESRRYMRVPYEFGAGPYPQTKKFDCSSYTQYVFGKFGVRLNRTARAQARQGTPVSRKLLRKGDLLFFSVPGRFKSNKTVGHVGIYIGNGKMINTYSNKKGVHIAEVNKGYWYKKYLKTRRVAY